MRKNLLFRGTGTALVTPFMKNGTVDEQAIRRLVQRQLKGGVEALLPTGTTGESVTLDEDEQQRVVEIVADETNGRIPVIAGAGTNSTGKTISLAHRMLAAGADGVLCVGPYYNKPTQEGYYRHYASIADALDAPLIVYNVPGRTAGNIGAETTLRIAEEIPAVAGIKEASANLGQIMEILRNRPDNFGVWSGDDAITLPISVLGADGVVSVVSNVVPGLFSKMVRLCLEGDYARALKIHNRLLPLMNFDFVESNPIPVKAVLAELHLIEEVYRLPLVRLGAAHRPLLKKILAGLGSLR